MYLAAGQVQTSSISGFFTSLGQILQSYGTPAAGVGLAFGGIKHAIAVNPQGREEAKNIMYGSGVGAVICLLAPAIIAHL